MAAERRIRVGVLFGGESAEHEVSLQSAKNVVDAIDPERIEMNFVENFISAEIGIAVLLFTISRPHFELPGIHDNGISACIRITGESKQG